MNLNSHISGFFILILLASFMFQACEKGPDYLHHKKFEGNCWQVSDSLHFDWEVKNNSLDLWLQAELQEAYGYTNLYLRVLLQSPSGKDSLITCSNTFIDPLGNWTTAASGKTHTCLIDCFSDIKLSESGTYKISLLHSMREDKLCDVKSIGILNEKLKVEN